ncbi:MAG TPA: hypothetical protein VEU30_11560, partial [Thermoanaerobaculia bacterium]|nr:hypothetical protein [Thermoanaerobaculia bacterium]
MNIRKLLAAFMIAAFVTTGAISAADFESTEAEQRSERAERESDLYEDGSDAIDDGEWEQAIDKFTQVAEMKGSRADGALYWTAYALNKLNRRSEALRTIEALRKGHPKSRWINDASALDLEIRQKGGERVKPENVDDDVKVIAIQTL